MKKKKQRVRLNPCVKERQLKDRATIMHFYIFFYIQTDWILQSKHTNVSTDKPTDLTQDNGSI